MNDLPLHPAVVHIPLGLAFVVPLLAVLLTLGVWRGWFRRRVWWTAILLQAVLTGGAFFAMNAGEEDEEIVERVVAENFLNDHEEQAEQFSWTALAVLVLTLAALVLPAGRPGRAAMLLAVIGSLAVLGLGLRAGHSGGQLVYVHGAAQAHGSDAKAGTDAREHEEREEHK